MRARVSAISIVIVFEWGAAWHDPDILAAGNGLLSTSSAHLAPGPQQSPLLPCA